MSRYDDYDDDYMDDNEIPEFQDEADFDDYLNDEEYDLMSQVLPAAKNKLKEEEYVGWNNFDVKLAIFDNDFDLDAALSHLRQSFKKKKVVVKAPPAPVAKITENLQKLKVSEPIDDWLTDEEDEELSPSRSAKEEVIIKPYTRIRVPTKPRNPIDMEKYLTENKKPQLSFVVLGHVDAGKSTLMGRLLYDIGAVDTKHMRKLKKESESIGKGSFHLAWVMDQTTEERERGVTVSICTSHFETEKAKFTIVDAPGHRDFVPNAIAGVSQADIAVLTIDCGIGAFESGFSLDGQTKEHTLLARSMDISNILVVMNKLDSVQWSEERFNEIKTKLSDFLLNDVGFKKEQISWVPCSGFSGEGVYKIPYPENLLEWYDGPNLTQTLEGVAIDLNDKFHNPKEVLNSPFLFSVMEVITTKKDDECFISGRVESGTIQPGESITIFPSEQSVLVDKILLNVNSHTSLNVASKGDFVTLKLRNSHPADIENGDLCASVEYDVSSMQTFTTRILTFQMSRPLLPGTPLMLFRGVCEHPARINKLISVLDKNDPTKVLKKKVKHISSNQVAIVEVELTERKRWLPMLTFDENKHLGRIILRKDGRTIATGAILNNE
ncbi:hypothetical protein KAFR_0H00330 [Kazachstania africana CBS 2517]|uniref:Elongation factor 1 alpha-like protein n=1 Tax=Kazachstania africana (strain ATCC 22294 / BCRC 22015 / CBS 2517 / CECT 1963 / NBRC 1671 / NRRL Y-8276) TaxID=1071382 RepID=H2AYN6_KAZAF|nr:hypothetical protein KAFR_0H00330 [Kazachstania africana CBS 2517]CCF59442.1 hypothetical protein KAFR_0H00330 [Kazachstania africana CBS 2517]